MNARASSMDALQAAEAEGAGRNTAGRALHEPFKWVRPDEAPQMLPASKTLQVMGRCLDVANGLNTALRVLDQIHSDAGQVDAAGVPARPLLSGNDAASLMRLAMAASDMLAEEISDYHEWVKQRAKRPSAANE
jgi:hypothetical protein